jgi:hypothetical protein
MAIEQYTPDVEAMKKEIDSWRTYFLDERFQSSFKFIPEIHKEKLVAYFLSIPSASFTDPWQEWNKCISALLQSLGS